MSVRHTNTIKNKLSESNKVNLYVSWIKAKCTSEKKEWNMFTGSSLLLHFELFSWKSSWCLHSSVTYSTETITVKKSNYLLYTNGSLYARMVFQCYGTNWLKFYHKNPWYYEFWIGTMNRFRVHRTIKLTSIITSFFYSFYWIDSTSCIQCDSHFKGWASCRRGSTTHQNVL